MRRIRATTSVIICALALPSVASSAVLRSLFVPCALPIRPLSRPVILDDNGDVPGRIPHYPIAWGATTRTLCHISSRIPGQNTLLRGPQTTQSVASRGKQRGLGRAWMSASASAKPGKGIIDGSQDNAVRASAPRTSSTTMSQITSGLFADLPIHEATKRSIIETMGYNNMTKVQQQSIPVALTGVDVLAKAKTGTGKTLAFLIPAIEAIVRTPRATQGISALIISPTRELANQIEEEAKTLLSKHSGLTVQCIVGGTSVPKDLAGFKSRPHILVATPGRLNDHLENNGIDKLMLNLRCLVFDEADQLLDMGFRPVITKILGALPPKETRQTLLFSATMPADVKTVAKIAAKSDFEYVDTVGVEENTHQHVDQEYVLTNQDDQIPDLVSVVRESMASEKDFKIIIFFTTARQTQLFAHLFTQLGFPVMEIHSRLSQSRRTSVSEAFRTATKSILFTSDVSARGMDYPDVTRVIQIGAPSDKAQYVHRLGRTARAGKQGSGVLMLCDYEKFFLDMIKDLPIQKRSPMSTQEKADIMPLVKTSLQAIDDTVISAAYQAWMGYYNAYLRKMNWSKEDLVNQANAWVTTTLGRTEVPPLKAKTVAMMGLKGVAGVQVSNFRFERNGDSGAPSTRGAAQAQRSSGGARGVQDDDDEDDVRQPRETRTSSFRGDDSRGAARVGSNARGQDRMDGGRRYDAGSARAPRNDDQDMRRDDSQRRGMSDGARLRKERDGTGGGLRGRAGTGDFFNARPGWDREQVSQGDGFDARRTGRGGRGREWSTGGHQDRHGDTREGRQEGERAFGERRPGGEGAFRGRYGGSEGGSQGRGQAGERRGGGEGAGGRGGRGGGRGGRPRDYD